VGDFDVADIIAFPERKPDQPTVLVADDEYMMRGVLTEILQDSGFVVIAAESGAEAVRILSSHTHIDAVFSDIKMPGMDGFALAKWVHENRPDTPVILASGYTGKTNMAADLCGAEFLRKPYDFDLIVEQLRQTLARRNPRSA
jgi:two-component system NtrC family sensor kinase